MIEVLAFHQSTDNIHDMAIPILTSTYWFKIEIENSIRKQTKARSSWKETSWNWWKIYIYCHIYKNRNSRLGVA